MSELPTFHIRFLFDNNFFTWEELGCLSRALGFPYDLFRRFFQSDVNCVTWNNKGVSSKTFHKMLEQASFHTKLHRSYNMHTSEWNVRVIEQTLNLLGHKALDFDDVYKARVAYTTYEHGDMKGMLLTKNVLLRTLKFCGRVISPMKLMHRVKHMKDQLDERGRIQLYEFFNLILWCDLYTRFDSKQVENSSGKVGDLFKIVDFRRLLSHHDERLANRLNDHYVREERTYGKPALGGSSKFTDPVVHTAPRMIQVKLHNEKYRHLQQEVTESDKRVCQAHAGNIRHRPITAPDLSKYSDTKELQDDFGVRCQYSRCTDNRRLRSAPARIKSKCPSSVECEVSRISNAVSADDVAEVNNKMANLRFDIITLDGRAQLNLDAEIDFYLPGYRDRRPSKETAKVTVPESKRKPEQWSTQIIERLTNPTNLKREFHSRCCDACQPSWQVQRERSKIGDTVCSNCSTDQTNCSPENGDREECTTDTPSSTDVSDQPRSCDQTTLTSEADDQTHEQKDDSTKISNDIHVPGVEHAPHGSETPKALASNNDDLTTANSVNSVAVMSAPIKTGVRKKVTWATTDIVLPLTSCHLDRQNLISPLMSGQNDEGITCLLNNQLLQDETEYQIIHDKNIIKYRKTPSVKLDDSYHGSSSHTNADTTTIPHLDQCSVGFTSGETRLDDLNIPDLVYSKTPSEIESHIVPLFQLYSNHLPAKNKVLSSLENCTRTEKKYNLRSVLESNNSDERKASQSCTENTMSGHSGVIQMVSFDSVSRDRQATRKTRRLARSRLLTRIRCARLV